MGLTLGIFGRGKPPPIPFGWLWSTPAARTLRENRPIPTTICRWCHRKTCEVTPNHLVRYLCVVCDAPDVHSDVEVPEE